MLSFKLCAKKRVLFVFSHQRFFFEILLRLLIWAWKIIETQGTANQGQPEDPDGLIDNYQGQRSIKAQDKKGNVSFFNTSQYLSKQPKTILWCDLKPWQRVQKAINFLAIKTITEKVLKNYRFGFPRSNLASNPWQGVQKGREVSPNYRSSPLYTVVALRTRIDIGDDWRNCTYQEWGFNARRPSQGRNT